MSGAHIQTLAKMTRHESVTLDVFDRICIALQCKIQDIIKVEVKY